MIWRQRSRSTSAQVGIVAWQRRGISAIKKPKLFTGRRMNNHKFHVIIIGIGVYVTYMCAVFSSFSWCGVVCVVTWTTRRPQRVYWYLGVHWWLRKWWGPVFCPCSELGVCSANHRTGPFSNQACDWLGIVWAYSDQVTENEPRNSSHKTNIYLC